MRKKFVMLRVVLAASFLLASVLPSQAAGMWYSVGPDTKYYNFKTIQEAVDAADPGDYIWVSPGEYEGAIVNKPLTIKGSRNKGTGELKTFIKGGKDYGFQLEKGADNTAIKNFRFMKKVNFPVFARGVDNVTVDNNTMMNPIQGITNWNGANWKIRYNNIYDMRAHWKEGKNYAGVGIVIGANGVDNETAKNNTVAFNKILGKVTPKDDGPYSCAGILLVDNATTKKADNASVTANVVDNNTIDLYLADPGVQCQLVGIMLNEIGKEETDGSVAKNEITDTTFGENMIDTAHLLVEHPYGCKGNTYKGNNQLTIEIPHPEYGIYDSEPIKQPPFKVKK